MRTVLLNGNGSTQSFISARDLGLTEIKGGGLISLLDVLEIA